MKVRALDQKNHDWTFGAGRQSYKEGKDAVAILVRTKLLSWLGDCYFALTDGVDWEFALGFKNSTDALLADIRELVLKTPGVEEIGRLEAILEPGRRVRIVLEISTPYGVQNLEVLQYA